MWYRGKPVAAQCEGCTLYTTQIGDLSYLHERDATYATLCQGPYEESVRYDDFMGWTMPWYSAPHESLETLLTGRRVGMSHLVCYLREDERVFETYWTNGRGVEAMGNTYTRLDLTPYGRQEACEDSPAGWPKRWGRDTAEPNPYRTNGRPIAQWPRLERSDDLEAVESRPRRLGIFTTRVSPGSQTNTGRRRDALLRAETELRDWTEAIAEQRRQLSLGGVVPTDYQFQE